MTTELENKIFDISTDMTWVNLDSPQFDNQSRVSREQDSNILGNLEVWVYGSDTKILDPSCHVRLKDGSFEFEVSLISWNIMNDHSWEDIGERIKNAFSQWLESNNNFTASENNKFLLYWTWDITNPNNLMETYLGKSEDGTLRHYLDS